MKRIKKIITVLLVATVVYSCSYSGEQDQNTSVEVTKENLTVADYAIEGMVCAMGCAGTIEKDVAALTGVLASKVDYEAGKGHFEFDKAVITEKEIIAKIESIADGQYSVDKWEEEKAIGNQIESDTNDEVEEEKITLNNVSLPSFKVPNLFTLLLDQI